MHGTRNPGKEDRVATQAVKRLTQAAIALLFAIIAIYLAS